MNKLILLNNKFLFLLLSIFLSKVSDQLNYLLITLVLIKIFSNNIIIGVIFFFSYVFFIIFGPIGGWLADNYNLKKLILFAEFLKIISIIISLIAYLYLPFVVIFIISGLLFTLGRSILQPSVQSALPKILLIKEDLIRANSLLQVSSEVSMILGSLLLSLLVIYDYKIGIFVVLIIYVLSFIIATLFLPNIKSTSSEKFTFKAILNTNVDDFKDLAQNNKNLYLSIIGSAICIFFTGAILKFIFILFMKEICVTNQYIGYFFSIMSVGTIIGGIIFSKLKIKIHSINTMIYWGLYGICLLLSFVFGLYNIYLFLLISFFIGFFGVFADILLISCIQMSSNENNIGKNFAIFSTFANVADSASSLLGGVFAFISIYASFAGMSIMIIITSIYTILKIKQKKE